MIRRLLLLAVGLICPLRLHGQDAVIPIVTGVSVGRVFSTTVLVENPGANDGSCAFTYHGPGRVDRSLVSREIIPAGRTSVYEDFLGGIASAGIVGVDCSSGLRVLARVQDSVDGGVSFRPGRLYRPFPIENAIGSGDARTVQASGDLVLAEVRGASLHVEVAAFVGDVALGTKSYDIPGYGQRVIRLASVLKKAKAIAIRIDVTSGEGRVAIGSEVREPALDEVALRRTGSSATVAESPRGGLVACAFQAGPFFEPGTGLCNFRDRWYDSRTGTFLSPDPKGSVDSPNLYLFAGGDPVNGRDPMGESASQGNSGWIIATRRNASFRRISPQEIAADPAGIRKFLMIESGLYWREAYDMVERAGQAERPTPLLRAAGYGTQMAEPVVNATGAGLVTMSNFTGVGSVAQITQSFLDDGATKTNVAMAGLTLIGLGAGDDLVRLGSTHGDDIAALAETGGRVGLTEQKTQKILAAGRKVKHHIFNKFRGNSPGSQKYRDFFKKHAIEVDEYAVEIPEAVHQKLIHGAGKNWTTRWREWIDAHPDASTAEVYQFAGKLMDEYGLSGLPIVPYR